MKDRMENMEMEALWKWLVDERMIGRGTCYG